MHIRRKHYIYIIYLYLEILWHVYKWNHKVVLNYYWNLILKATHILILYMITNETNIIKNTSWYILSFQKKGIRSHI
jgi:hypothetical protein